MGLVTFVHHLHAALAVDWDGAGWHVVWNEVVLIPLTVVAMLVFVRTGSRIALFGYLAIAAFGFLGLGLYEGFWNHTAKLIGHLRLDGPTTDIALVLPSGDVNLWFHEITGVMTFVVTMVASYFALLFGRSAIRSRRLGLIA